MLFVPADQVEPLVAKVADLFRDAEARLLARMAASVTKGLDSPHWAEEQLLHLTRYRRQSEQVLEQLRRGLSAASGGSVLTSAARGQASALAQLGRAITPADAGRKTVDTEAVLRLAGELTGTLQSAAQPILRVTDDAYRRVISEVGHRMILGEATQQQAAQDALNEFARRGITSFVGRTGRRMRIEHYVEMSVRASLMNATVQGHVDRLQDMGTRLVVVSDVPQECKLCRPFEGKVLALDDADVETIDRGKRIEVDATLAEARAAGLFHPGCRHSIAPWRRNMRSFGETADPQGDKDRQTLRRYEREVRAARREELVALDDDARKAARKKAAAWQARIRHHVDTTSAKRQPQRERITGTFKPVELTPPKRGSVTPIATGPTPAYRPAKHTTLDAWTEREIAGAPDRPDRNARLAHIFAKQGWNGPVQTLGDVEFDAAAKASPSGPLYRGVATEGKLAAKDMQRAFLEDDDAWIGEGVYGNGWYTSTKLGTAQAYANLDDGVSTTDRSAIGDSIIEVALRPTARIFEPQKDAPAIPKKEWSEHAAKLGYDAMRIQSPRPGEYYYVVLNRSAIVARELQK